MGTRQQDLRATLPLAHGGDVALHAVAVLELLAGHVLGGEDQTVLPIGLGTQVHHGNAALVGAGVPVDDTGDHGALQPDVLVEGALGPGDVDLGADGVADGEGGGASEILGGVIELAGDPALVVEFLAQYLDRPVGAVDHHPCRALHLGLFPVGTQQGIGDRVQQ